MNGQLVAAPPRGRLHAAVDTAFFLFALRIDPAPQYDPPEGWRARWLHAIAEGPLS